MSAVTAASAAFSAAQAADLARTTKKRKALHAYLSDDAHETWHQFAATHGISVSATLEALAAELQASEVADGGSIDFDPIVSRARQTDAARRRRRR